MKMHNSNFNLALLVFVCWPIIAHAGPGAPGDAPALKPPDKETTQTKHVQEKTPASIGTFDLSHVKFPDWQPEDSSASERSPAAEESGSGSNGNSGPSRKRPRSTISKT